MENDIVSRINQAVNYIMQNLDRNLTVEEIADYCCFSKFYFNRLFKSIVGESIYSFTKRLKLESAAFKLRTAKTKTITDIALESGYSPSNFASAFKEYFGISATYFRKVNEVPLKDSYSAVVEHIQSMKKREDFFAAVDAKIKVKKLDKMTLLYERFIGNYADLSDHWDRFCMGCEQRNLLGRDTKFIGISYDDPLIADENRCMYDMCVTVDKPDGTNIHRIEEGFYACYEFHDRLENLVKAYNEIFTLWLPYTRYECEYKIPLEIYHSNMDEEGRMKLDLCIPIR